MESMMESNTQVGKLTDGDPRIAVIIPKEEWVEFETVLAKGQESDSVVWASEVLSSYHEAINGGSE